MSTGIVNSLHASREVSALENLYGSLTFKTTDSFARYLMLSFSNSFSDLIISSVTLASFTVNVACLLDEKSTAFKRSLAQLIAVFSIATLICSLMTKDIDGMFFIDVALGSIALCFISTLAIPINDIKRIRAGGRNYSFGTLSQTHLVIIGWSDSKFDRTVYIPVSEIESMELNKDATPRHGTVVVKIKGRNKPLITNDIVEPQKLIDVFNNLETFIESPHGK